MTTTENLPGAIRETDQTDQTSSAYTFTVSGAASACDVSTKTILRKVTALTEHGAMKDMSGQWQIPLAALYAVGLHPGKPKGPDPVDTSADNGQDVEQVSAVNVSGQSTDSMDNDELVRLRQTVESLQVELQEVRKLADERIETIADVNRVRAEFAETHLSKLLALPAGSPPSATANSMRTAVWLPTVISITALIAVLVLIALTVR